MLHFKVVITWQQLEVLVFLVLCSEIIKASLLELFNEMKTLQKPISVVEVDGETQRLY